MTELFHNIRGLYRFEEPCGELKDYIEFFSESCFTATEQIVRGQSFSIKMFKSWTPTFWINLGPSYNLILDGIVHRVKAHSAIAVARAVTAERLNQPSDHLFTVKFYPGALNHLLGIDQAKLGHGLTALNELLPGYLVHQIKSAGCFEERLHLMEQYLLQQMINKKTVDHYTSLVNQTIATYYDDGMRLNVSELARRAFTSSKTLTRYFERIIGIGPKQYIESVRARTALSSYLKDKKSFDATAYGYYDKSHFYKSIVSFTGEPLSEQR